MKKLLLVDFDLNIVNSIMEKTDWEIVILVTVNNERVNIFKNNKRIKKILFIDEFYNNDNLEFLEYEDIKKFYYAQLKCENCYNRNIIDYQLGKENYYRGLSLVKKIYTENIIDIVLVCNINHGHTYDCLIVEMAKNLKISCFNIEDMLFNKSIIFNNITNQLLPVNNFNMQYDDSLFYTVDYDNDNLNAFGYNQNYIGNLVRKGAYLIGGYLGIIFLGCIRHLDLRPDRFGVNFLNNLSNYLALKDIKRYLNKISANLDNNSSYIYYSLHFEPEATVAGRSILNSQIIIIKMISQLLPEGWTLYIKEHPHQFKCNTYAFYPFLYNSVIFKSKNFYKEINKIPNVKFLKTEISPALIIKNAKAIATMSGTVALEAAKLNKPVLVFASERTIYNKCKGFYKINSYRNCADAIKDIINEKNVDYSDIDEVCMKYLINNNKNGFNVAIEAIKQVVENDK